MTPEEMTQIVETGTRTVTVNAPFRVVHDGIAYIGGETATVPLTVADAWIAAHWVTPVEGASVSL